MLIPMVLILYYEMMLQALNVSLPFILFVFLTLIIFLLYLLFKDDEEPNVSDKVIEQIEFSLGPDIEGGMAEIWFCKHPNRKIVVKFPKNIQKINNDTITHRFRTEVLLHKNLQHKNIVEFIEAGEFKHPIDKDNRRYLILSFIDGCTLKKIIEDFQPLHPSIIFEIVGKILDALEYIHNKCIVHRDLSWYNIMVDIFGQVYLIDFGNATTLGKNDTEIIRKQNPDKNIDVLGTPYFYPPPDVVDNMPNTAAKDFYALAILMYFMYGGSKPEGENATEMRANVNKNLQDLDHIPSYIKIFLLHCLKGYSGNVSDIRKDLRLQLQSHKLDLIVKDIVSQDSSQQTPSRKYKDLGNLSALVANHKERIEQIRTNPFGKK